MNPGRFQRIAALLLALSPALTALEIIDDGRSAAVIILPAEPAPLSRRAATVLQEYLQRASGAKLPIHSEIEAPAVPMTWTNDNNSGIVVLEATHTLFLMLAGCIRASMFFRLSYTTVDGS